MNFFSVRSLDEVLATVRQLASLRAGAAASEFVPLEESLGRICAAEVAAPFSLPEYRRSTVDGYAVRAADVRGASESVPSLLECLPEILMGGPEIAGPGPGQAIPIPTGGTLPVHADAVVMVEHTEHLDARTLLVHKPVAPGDGVSQIGDDVAAGEVLLGRGQSIGPAEIGLLAGLGIGEVAVAARPRVAVLSTGDELVAIGQERAPGRIFDMNGPALAAAVRQNGAVVASRDLVIDNDELLRSRMAEALGRVDCLILSGGSSVGHRDHTRTLIESFPQARVLAHGVAIKPGKPTIVATIGDTVVFGLPGHPLAAMMVFQAVVLPFLHVLQGARPREIRVPARLEQNVHSAPGRTTLQLVRLRRGGGGWLAQPLYGQSGHLSLLSRASGYVSVAAQTEGFMKDDQVEVVVFQEKSLGEECDVQA